MFKQILTNLDYLAGISSTKEKQQLLASMMKDEFFSLTMQYMLDPFKTFGILSFTPYEGNDSHICGFGEFLDFLDDLVARKTTGDTAREIAGRYVNAGIPAELMTRILNKDPKCGVGETLVNKVVPGLIPSFPYQRCALPKDAKFHTWDWANGVISQEKADGMFASINKTMAGDLTLNSRQGSMLPIDKFEALRDVAAKLLDPNTQTHGELLVCEEGRILPREQGNGVLNSILKGGELARNQAVMFKAWDQIPLDKVKPKMRFEMPYGARFAVLRNQLHFNGETYGVLTTIDTRYVDSLAGAYAHCKELMLEGKEGTIIKERQAPWIDGTSKFQIKLKLEADCDLVAVGFREGKGKNAATFGSIIFQTSDGLLEVAVSGFTDGQRKEIHARREQIPGTIWTVRGNLVLEPSPSNPLHSIFLPRIVEERWDKSEADTLQRVKDQFQAAINMVG